jgi:predicted hotdog family 3-hydroxylacyl-ACP dehydratase
MPEYNINNIVPHSKGMSLLDQLLHHDEESAQTRVTIHEKSYFANPKGVPSWVGIEYMAQTIAAYGGIQDQQAGNDVRIGFLVGTRKYTCNQPYFTLGSTLTISIVKEFESDNGLQTFRCEISSEDIKAQANINVFQPENIDEFLSTETK